MGLVIVGIVGACLGVSLAQSRVPRVRWVPLVATILLILVAAALIIQMPAVSSLPGGIVLATSVVLGSVLYAASLWSQEGIDSTASYWTWVWRDTAHPRYLRSAYADAQHNNRLDGASVESPIA
jgi:hypothetical protein